MTVSRPPDAALSRAQAQSASSGRFGRQAPSGEPSALRDGTWTATTYFAEGLPYSLLHQVASQFFTHFGASAIEVGKTALLHGPMLLKGLFSPVVERVLTLRKWMVLSQAAMGVIVGWLATLALVVERASEPSQANTTYIWLALLAVGTLSAIHDIACDGFYMEALSDRRQSLFTGLRIAAFRLAMLVGSSGLVFLGGHYSFLLAFGVGALLLGFLALFHQLFLPHPIGARAQSREEGAHRTSGDDVALVLDSYLSFVRQKAAGWVVAFLLFYKAADVLMFSMSSVLLQNELGIGTDLRGTMGVFSIGSSIVGAVLGGLWVSKRGLAKTLVPITLLMAVTEPLYAVLASLGPELAIFVNGSPATWATFEWQTGGLTLSLATATIIIEQLCGGLATAAQLVFIMRRCDPAHKTSHFAFATVVYSIAHISLGFASGYAFEWLGSVGYYWGVSAFALPAVLCAYFVPKEPRTSSQPTGD